MQISWQVTCPVTKCENALPDLFYFFECKNYSEEDTEIVHVPVDSQDGHNDHNSTRLKQGNKSSSQVSKEDAGAPSPWAIIENCSEL